MTAAYVILCLAIAIVAAIGLYASALARQNRHEIRFYARQDDLRWRAQRAWNQATNGFSDNTTKALEELHQRTRPSDGK